MNKLQPAILQKSTNGRFLIYNFSKDIQTKVLRNCLLSLSIDEHTIVGLGKNAIDRLNLSIEDYREFPQLDTTVEIPSTGGDVFVFIRDSEAGKIAIRSLQIKQKLSQYMQLQLQVDGFKYLGHDGRNGHDLTGYEDGTENPSGADAITAVQRTDGSCFVALQQWQHNLQKFNTFNQNLKDNTIGRRLSDNEELSDAPVNSHVHRTDQATFDIEADILRRSLPWSNEHGEGLMFMAFCENLERFEVQMRRMAGLEDGITDALFTFTKILNSAYFYCPAVKNNKLVL